MVDKRLQKIEFVGPYVGEKIIALAEREKPSRQPRLPKIVKPSMERCILHACCAVWFSWSQQKLWAQFTTRVEGYGFEDESLKSLIPDRDMIKASTYSDSVDDIPRLREAWFLEVSKALHDKYDASRLSKGTRYRIIGPDGEVIAAAADALTSPLNPPSATTGYGRYGWFRGEDGRDDESEDDFEDEEDGEDDLEDEEMGQAVANG